MGHIRLDDNDPVLHALKAIRAEAHRLEESPGYHFESVRSLAERLGFGHMLEEILYVCASNGFSYCLDRTIASHGPDGPREFPPQDVCFWGADQLRSRLDCVDWRLR